MVTQRTFLTVAEFEALPDDGRRYELIAGDVVVLSAPTKEHQLALLWAYRLIFGWVDPRTLGLVLVAPYDIAISDRDIVQPDLLYVRKEREAILTSRRCEGAPDLVVEILSPTTRGRDLIQKSFLYARAGVPEYWLIDVDAKTFEIWFLERGVYRPVEADADGRAASTVLRGLVVDSAPFFSTLS